MTRNTKDIFGQIDALLGKRSPEILADKAVADDDFPMLTEVIEACSETAWDGRETAVSMLQGEDRRIKERRVAQRRESLESTLNQADYSHEMNMVLERLDLRLAEHFQLQRQQFEESLRQTLREFLRETRR